MKKGIVQIYTGEGKGKTTAAVGLAIRGAGHNLKVGFFQFFKPPVSGEVKIFNKIRNIKFFSYLQKHPYFQKFSEEDIKEYRKEMKSILKEILKIIKEKKFDIVILDEILIAVRDGFLKEDDLLKFIEKKPSNIELILTGRYKISERMKKKVNLITEMKNIKHPYPGVKARKGIEF